MKLQSISIFLASFVMVSAASLPAQTRPAAPPAAIPRDKTHDLESIDLDLLIDALHKDETARANAVAGLTKIGRDAIPRLRDVVKSEAPAVVRYAAADAWARIDATSDISTDELKFRLQSSSPGERTEATAALRYRKLGLHLDPAGVPVLEQNPPLDAPAILQHGTPAEQIDVLNWIKRVGWRMLDIAPLVRTLLDAPSAEVCQAAADALGGLEGLTPDATVQLLDAAKSHDGYTRRLAIEVLANSSTRFYDKKIRQELQVALHDPSWLVRRPAAQGLIGWWEDFTEDFTAAMKSGDDTVKQVVMDDLLSGDSRILRILTEMRLMTQVGRPDRSRTPEIIAFADQVAPDLFRLVQTGERRERAFEALRVLPLDTARALPLESVKAALADPIAGNRASAARWLGDLWPQSLQTLADGTRAADPEVRAICVSILTSKPESQQDPIIVAALTEAISDSSEPVRQLAILWASKLSYAPDGIARRLADLTRPSNPSYVKNVLERTQVIQLLGQFAVDPKSSIPALTLALDENERPIQMAAVIALRPFGADASPALPRLLQLFHENNTPSWQEQIADTLLSIGPDGRKAIAPYFVERIGQPMERDSLIATIRALSRIGPESAAAVPALENLLLEVDNEIRMEAARALGEIGPAAGKTIPALTHMVDNHRPEIRETATQALLKISLDGKGLGPALLAAVYNGDRSCAARLAASLRSTGADRAIVRRLDDLASEDPDAAVRATARHVAEFLSANPSSSRTTQPKAG